MREPNEFRRRAERAAAKLPALLVAAERVASTVSQGVHGRRRVGQGETFWQFRRYEPGDPIQSIDWRQSAKRQRAYVRETEWEAAQSVWLWRDGSPSMRYRSQPTTTEKGERADLLLLALAVMLVRGGEHVALLGEDMVPSNSRATLDRLTHALTAAAPLEPANGDAEGAVPGFAPLPRHAHLVLFGDFLAPLETIDAAVRRFANGGVRGHLAQVLDPAEETLPFRGRSLFEGLESEDGILVRRAERIRDAYAGRMATHQLGLADIARSVGWSFARHRTDRPPETALLGLYTILSVVPGV